MDINRWMSEEEQMYDNLLVEEWARDYVEHVNDPIFWEWVMVFYWPITVFSISGPCLLRLVEPAAVSVSSHSLNSSGIWPFANNKKYILFTSHMVQVEDTIYEFNNKLCDEHKSLYSHVWLSEALTFHWLFRLLFTTFTHFPTVCRFSWICVGIMDKRGHRLSLTVNLNIYWHETRVSAQSTFSPSSSKLLVSSPCSLESALKRHYDDVIMTSLIKIPDN